MRHTVGGSFAVRSFGYEYDDYRYIEYFEWFLHFFSFMTHASFCQLRNYQLSTINYCTYQLRVITTSSVAINYYFLNLLSLSKYL